MNVEELIKLIKRGEISAPKQNHNETPSAYRMRLIKVNLFKIIIIANNETTIVIK